MAAGGAAVGSGDDVAVLLEENRKLALENKAMQRYIDAEEKQRLRREQLERELQALRQVMGLAAELRDVRQVSQRLAQEATRLNEENRSLETAAAVRAAVAEAEAAKEAASTAAAVAAAAEDESATTAMPPPPVAGASTAAPAVLPAEVAAAPCTPRRKNAGGAGFGGPIPARKLLSPSTVSTAAPSPPTASSRSSLMSLSPASSSGAASATASGPLSRSLFSLSPASSGISSAGARGPRGAWKLPPGALQRPDLEQRAAQLTDAIEHGNSDAALSTCSENERRELIAAMLKAGLYDVASRLPSPKPGGPPSSSKSLDSCPATSAGTVSTPLEPHLPATGGAAVSDEIAAKEEVALPPPPEPTAPGDDEGPAADVEEAMLAEASASPAASEHQGMELAEKEEAEPPEELEGEDEAPPSMPAPEAPPADAAHPPPSAAPAALPAVVGEGAAVAAPATAGDEGPASAAEATAEGSATEGQPPTATPPVAKTASLGCAGDGGSGAGRAAAPRPSSAGLSSKAMAISEALQRGDSSSLASCTEEEQKALVSEMLRLGLNFGHTIRDSEPALLLPDIDPALCDREEELRESIVRDKLQVFSQAAAQNAR